MKAYFLLLVLLVPLSYQQGVPVKYYQSYSCPDIFKHTSQQLFDGVRAVLFLPESNAYLGYYQSPGLIKMFGTCDKEVLIHELAHHQQYMAGEGWKITNHVDFGGYLDAAKAKIPEMS